MHTNGNGARPSSRFNVAFVGCGGFAQLYWPAYRDLPSVHVNVCVDLDAEIAAQAAAVIGHGSRTSRDFSEALAEDIDVVVINTPNHLHRQQAVAALQAGKHVLLQKPAATNLAEGLEIADAAALSSARIGIYMSYLEQPLMHRLRGCVREGCFGSVVAADAVVAHRGGLRWSEKKLTGEATWRSSKQHTGGGCGIQMGIHYLFLLEWLLDSPIRRVRALANNLLCPGIDSEDQLAAVLEFDNGTAGTLSSSWSSAGELLSLRGSDAHMFYTDLSLLSGEKTLLKALGVEAPDGHARLLPPALGDATNPYNQHRQFFEALASGAPLPVPLDVALNNLAVIESIYESARTGTACDVAPVGSQAVPV